MPREVYDYGHVLHELQLNAWGSHTAGPLETFFCLGRERRTSSDRARRGAQQGVLRVGDYWSAESLRDPRPRLVRPDAVLEVARPDRAAAA